MTKGKVTVLVLIIAAVFAFFYFDLGSYFTLDAIKAQRESLLASFEKNPLLVSAGFFAVYVLVTALSLPGAALMTLLAGAIFGLLWGTVLVSFASSIGATLAFLASRFICRDWVQGKMGKYLAPINKGIEEEGAFYLFTMRLVPAIPFMVINLVMGLTTLKTKTFYWVSQVGMLLGTIVFVNAGSQLAQVTTLKGILSPGLIGSFVLLGALPLVAKKIIGAIKKNKADSPAT
jgi:uncharacterized membrane protein YdjX (TVP38/TMEM64 family)